MLNFVTLTMVCSAETYNDDGEAVETNRPVKVNPETVRCFYARRNDKPGTRITFANGRGFAVTEDVEAVSAALMAASGAPNAPPTALLTDQR